MTTTDHFQKNPDFFLDKTEEKREQTNPRYKNYTQTHFTAGDIEQFQLYRDRSNGSNPNPLFDASNNVWESQEVGENLDWKKYANLTTQDIDHTFFYIFEKFKKGVFVKIKDNKLSVFLPFSKHNYVNEWSNYIKHNKSFKDITDFLIYASSLQGYNVKPKHINAHINTWYANNCLVRSEFPIGENDRCISNLKDMLVTLCNERIVPDIELFFNRRDFPLIKKDSTEPYEHIFNSDKFPLQSHKYDKYCPILSMVTTNTNSDIPFPTMEDWARASNQEESKLFSPDFKEYKYKFNLSWDKKVPTAVFRGSSTGCGVTVDTNPRLKLAQMSLRSPVIDGIPLLDAGITKWNCRPRKIMNHEYLEVIDPTKFEFALASFMSPVEQSNYKYVINVDGHVSAFRLSLEMSMGSVILLQDSKYRVWFRKYLKEYEHYVPVNEDLSNLYQQIQWCRQNDEKCKQIAMNALSFYQTYLTKKGMLDFVQSLFFNIKKVTGTYYYNYQSVKDIIYQKQLLSLSTSKTKHDSFVYPFKRDINAMNGFEIFMDRHMLPTDHLSDKKEIHESKDSTINSYKLDKLSVTIKTSKRKHELINEAFVGLNCVNHLLKEIPNFKYTFGIEDEQLVSEYIDGIPFNKYIKECTIGVFVSILRILFLTLAVAQERYGFVHNDLTPWNIMIKTLPKKETFIYQFKDQIVTVETNILPIIIDYDRSHAIVDGMHHGIIDPFKTSKFQDCFCLITNAIHEFCLRQMNQLELQTVLHMINFMTETDFHEKKIATFNELIDFLTINKKYNEIVYKNKCDLESFEPCDYFNYLGQHAPTSTIIIKSVDGSKVRKEYSYINPILYYNMITSQPNHEKMLQYINKIEEQVMYMIDKFLVNYVYYIHSLNQIHKTISNLKTFIETYSTKDDSFTELRNCNRILARITTQYEYKTIQQETPVCSHLTDSFMKNGRLFCKICEKDMDTFVFDSKIMISPHYQPNFSLAKYDPYTFSIPSKILSILQGNSELRNENMIQTRYMLRDMLLYDQPFVLPHEKEFAKKYGLILSNLSPLSILNHNANINTLQMISHELYPNDLSELQKLPELPLKTIRTIQMILTF